MLSLRPCIKHSFLKPSLSNLSLFPLIFLKNPNHSYSTIFKMSQSPKKKDAFAVMMSKRPNPNTKNSKSTSSTSSSPKKLKTLDSNSKPQINSTQITNQPDPISNSNKIHNSPQIPISPNELIQDSPKNPKVEIENGPKNEEKGINVDESILQLKKSPEKFNPKKAGYWGEGKRVPFLFLARVFDAVANESGRNANIDIVCNMLRTVIDATPDDLVQIVYLLANRIAPAHEGLELGIGDASIIKALAEACGAKETHIKKQYKELGDLGLVVKASRSSQPLMWKPQPLTVAKVFETFRVIAKESGKDSQDKKKNHIKGLLVAATDCEPLYLIRLLQTKLRIGLGEETLLTALGHAIFYTEKHSSLPANSGSSIEEAAKIVKQVYSVLPVYEKIVPALLSGGVWNLPKTCFFSLGVPVGPMLAKPTKGVSEILDKFQNIEFTCEYKYDGERAQIHYLEDGTVQIYSRNAERNTEKFPDVVVAVTRVKKPSVTSFVLDCELVAYDREKQKILPFQILTTRARKNVVMSEIKVDVCIYAFDLLYLNGQQLLQEQLNIRRERLYESFVEEPGFFQHATAVTSNDLEEIQTFLDAAVDASCEGLIIKTLTRDATYEPAKRSNNWLKLKKDYMDSIGDSLDLVPIGAFHGKGKRVGGYGAFLLACYDYDKDEYQTICKTGTGFSDQVLEERSNSLRAKVIPSPKPYYRCGSINPDVWFEASEVWEVKAADLTISPVYCAAIGAVDPNKGISLRFPRLLRVRDDKGPEEATSSEMARNHPFSLFHVLKFYINIKILKLEAKCMCKMSWIKLMVDFMFGLCHCFQVADMYNAQKHTQSSNKNNDD